MSNDPKPASNEPAIRLVMMPKDTNADGTIFGGVILSLMDQAAYIEAMRQIHRSYATVSFKEVIFKQPVFVGDVLSIYADTAKFGRTSMTIRVRVCARRRTEPDTTVEVTKGEVVFVAIDNDRRPVPLFGK